MSVQHAASATADYPTVDEQTLKNPVEAAAIGMHLQRGPDTDLQNTSSCRRVTLLYTEHPRNKRQQVLLARNV